MADPQTGYKYDADGNRYRFNYARDEWEPIGEDFGIGETLKEGAQSALTRLGAGIGQLYQTGSGVPDAIREEQDARLSDMVAQSDEELRMAGGDIYRPAAIAGQAAPYAAAGAVLPQSLPGAVASEAALGALSYGTPQERALAALTGGVGAGVGVGLGQGVRGVARARTGRLSDRVRAGITDAAQEADAVPGGGMLTRQMEGGNVGPGGASGAKDLAQGSRLRKVAENRIFPDTDPNVLAVREADQIGYKLSPGMRRGSKGQQVAEEATTRNPGALSVWNREIADPNNALGTSIAREGMGLPAGNKLTDADFQLAEDAIFEGYEELASKAPGSYLITNDDVAKMHDILNANVQIPKVRRQLARDLGVDDFEKALAGETPESMRPFSDARLKSQDLLDLVRDTNETIGEQTLTGARKAAEEIRNLWEARFNRMVPDTEEAQKQLKELNERFRIKKLVESPGVWTGDEINVKSLGHRVARDAGFGKAFRRTDYVDGRGRPLELRTRRLVQLAKVSRAFPQALNNSGTPTGQIFSEGLGSGIEKMLASRAGAEMYFGNPLGALKSPLVNIVAQGSGLPGMGP